MTELLASLSPEVIVTVISAVAGLVMSVVALINKIRAKKVGEALDEASDVGQELMKTIDAFKLINSSKNRKPLLKDLGARLDAKGLKEKVDAELAALGLDSKS